jgi:predicted permease
LSDEVNMKTTGIRAGVRRLFRLPLRSRERIHDDVDAELESYLDARVEYLVARGMSTTDARTEAVRRLGVSLDEARRRLHHSAEHRESRMQLRERVDDFVQDLRYAARGLAHRPAFTTVAVLTLAIGIGATTAIFSAVNALLLRPLPFDKPDELMGVTLVTPARPGRPSIGEMVWSYPKSRVFRDNQRVFSQLALYSGEQFNLTSGDVERVWGESVSATYLATVGVKTAVGRDFPLDQDAHPNAPRLALIGDALWQRRFNADPAIVGKTIDVDRQPFTIIGVTRAGFRGLSGQAEIFVPITTRSADELSEAQSHEFNMVARRTNGVSVEQAAAATRTLGARVNEAFPDRFSNNGQWGAKAQPLDNARVSSLIKRSLFVLFGAVGLVLLIACVNVANLLIGRANTRRREIAVRLAIGAGRGRLLRLLLTESLLLSTIGGVASVLVAWWGTRLLSSVNPSALRFQRGGALGAVGFSSVRLDAAALVFTLGVAVLVGLLFGLAPALHATRASVSNALKDGAVGAGRAKRFSLSGRRLLVMIEVALAIVLLAGSGLMIRSLANLLRVDTGFETNNVLTLRLSVPPGSVPRDSLPGFYTELLGRLSSLPGVRRVSFSDCPPLNAGCNGTLLEFLDRPKVPTSQQQQIGVHWATTDWFATLGIPLERGRLFTPADRVGAPKVVLVSRTAARTFWPNEDPIGKRVAVHQGGFSDGAEVIGIVGDVRQYPDSLPKPDVYISYFQSPRPGLMIFVRTVGDPAALGPTIRRAIREVAPRYPVYDMKPFAERTASATAQARFSSTLLTLFAIVALSLAALGIYGVMSLAVTQRTREIGIRMALGADARRVLRLVVGEGIALAAWGAALGLAGAFAATRVLRSFLFDIQLSDPITYVSIVLLLGTAAALASWIPARRATRVQPTEALRES